jgi:pimeloyl-ACP methyl ester carboxylesterase
MKNGQRTHEITTDDGVTIAGTVRGHGPPVVFSPGGIGDAELDWQQVLPYLTDQFTCYLPSLRGRGLSGENADLRLDRLVEDLAAYVDSVGGQVGLVGWSAGGMVLAVAAKSDTVDAVAAVEPTMFHLMDEEERAGLAGAVTRVRELAADGNMPEAVRTFLGVPFNEAELTAVDATGYFEATGRYVPTLLNQLAQTMKSEGRGPDDPSVLGAISAEVLVLYGSDTKPFLEAGASYVADHVPNAALRELPGVGHAAPLTHPETVAEALGDFFSSTLDAA